ncbi:MAG: cystathionine beta-synthase [Thermoleophilia bacterium]
MKYHQSVLETIGQTPLVRLNRVTDGLPVTLLGKFEAVNPGGSIKDRIGVAMIADAEAHGLLKPGGTIIEATAGNTGVGLALAAAVKGYHCIFVLPDKMSQEKVALLQAYGAEIVLTPSSVAPDSPESYNGVADRLAREISGAFRPGQFGNQRNPEAHYLTTGPEIWRDTEGRIDAFVAGVGTGGTISGVGRYLKERKPEVTVVCADPQGSILSGDSPRAYLVEGIGEDYVPATFDRQVVDEFVRVSDAESFAMARRLAREEGLLVGGSSGTAVAAALKYARRLPAGAVIVAALPDTGRNYLSTFYSDRWLEEHGLAQADRPRISAGDVLHAKRRTDPLISVGSAALVIDAVRALELYDISQLPVIDGGEVVGNVNEAALAKALHDGVDPRATSVADVMGSPPPQIDEATDISEPYRLLLGGHGGVLVAHAGTPVGLLTRYDLLDYWTAARDDVLVAP